MIATLNFHSIALFFPLPGNDSSLQKATNANARQQNVTSNLFFLRRICTNSSKLCNTFFNKKLATSAESKKKTRAD